jgi:serine/threonine protein kinase
LDDAHGTLASARLGSCIIDEKYQLIKRIGCGGMGAVYEGTHLELDRALAVKILVPEYASADPQARLRLRQEALTVCSFDHPNLVRLYDFGTNVISVKENGRVHAYDELYIVMELLRGQSLKEILACEGRLSLSKAVAIAAQTAEGLAEIHDKNIVHRDLKPANILICSDHKGDLLVKIVDFGAVKMLPKAANNRVPDLTKALFVGSPLYASPENCKGDTLDERSDLYSLGLILYEMIAGHRAFEDGDFLTLLNSHAYASPPPLKDIPNTLDDLTMKALRKNPNERPQTASEFAGNLRVLDLGGSKLVLHNSSNGSDEPVESDPDLKRIDENEETVVSKRLSSSAFGEENVGGHKDVEGRTHDFSKVQIPIASMPLRVFGAKRRIGVTAIVLICLAGTATLSVRRNKSANSATVASVSATPTPQPSSTPPKREETRLQDATARPASESGTNKSARTVLVKNNWLDHYLKPNKPSSQPTPFPYVLRTPRSKPLQTISIDPSVLRRMLASSKNYLKTDQRHAQHTPKNQKRAVIPNYTLGKTSRDRRTQIRRSSRFLSRSSGRIISRRRR